VAAERARLFVALDLPAPARQSLERWRSAALREVQGLRAVAPEALHATLCFLGWHGLEEIEPIAAACAGALAGCLPPRLTFAAPVWLPARRPRVLAVGLADPSGALARIQEAASAALSAGGWYELERRPFLAHVTVARVPGRTRVAPVGLPPVHGSEFEGASVTVFRSLLGRGGARYEPQLRIELD
jgi:RNA 2',3'-cyclic 3'-phosphodiesterase